MRSYISARSVTLNCLCIFTDASGADIITTGPDFFRRYGDLPLSYDPTYGNEFWVEQVDGHDFLFCESH